jgi:hypothetical protein
VNGAEQNDRLPESIGGLIGFAFATWWQRAPLYLGVGVVVFALQALAQAFAPDNAPVAVASGVVGDALMTAIVALHIATRATGGDVSTRRLVSAGIVRWGDVTGATALATVAGVFVAPLMIPGSDQTWLFALLPAWLLMGALSYAGPVTAITHDRPIVAIATGFGRALLLGLRFANLGRTFVAGAWVVLVFYLQTLVLLALHARHVPHELFWANAPLDALTVGPLAAILTAFALDAARRLRERTAPPT